MSIESEALRQLIDKQTIYEIMCRYARGVDRGDWELLRSTYHPDAYDDHGDYKGDVDGLLNWLKDRFDGVDNSQHFLGNFLVEFLGADVALVEAYFVSRRLTEPTQGGSQELDARDVLCRQVWGRYLDRFERRSGEWKVATRRVVVDSRYLSVAIGGARSDGPTWGHRDSSDPLYLRESSASGEARA